MNPLTEDERILWTALFDQSGDAMVVLRQDGCVCQANQRFADMLGYTLDELKGLYVWDWDIRFSQQELQEMLLTVDNSGACFDSLHRRKDGTVIDTEINNNCMFYRGERLIFCIVRDITARKSTETRLRQNEALLQGIASQVPGALYQYRMAPDGSRSFTYYNEGFIELGGLTDEQLCSEEAAPIMSLIHPEDADFVETKIQASAKTLSHLHIEFRIQHDNGSIFWIESRSIPEKEPDGSITWTGILLDITQRVQAEERMRIMAITDGPTGIANRQEFERLLKHEIKRAMRYHTPLSLLMYDLDHFKQVNDNFGHHTGDVVLTTVTSLVNDNIRGIDIHGRWGGEEFMVILSQTELDAAMDVADKLRQAIAAYHFDQIGTVTASFGVAELAPQENIESLSQRVDKALYRAKDGGRNRVEK